MIPLKDANPTTRAPVVTVALIFACVIVYLFVEPVGQVVVFRHSTADSVRRADADFSYRYAAIPCEIVRDRPLAPTDLTAGCQRDDPGLAIFPTKGVFLAVLYSMFLHGSLLHIAGNMLFLWIFGNNVEERLGHTRYLLFYLVAGLIATLAYVISDPGSTAPLLGASGAIAGVMGAYLVFFPRARIRTLILLPPIILWPRLPAFAVLGFWFVSQFFLAPGSGVAWVSHVGGFAFGALVGWRWPQGRAPGRLAGAR